MKTLQVITALMAIIASDLAYAEGAVETDSLEGHEVITTTRTVERIDEDGQSEPVEHETTTETILDIPVESNNEQSEHNGTVPCYNPPNSSSDYFDEDFVENNEDDDSDIAAETGILPESMHDNGLDNHEGYALDEVPPELLEENPVNPDDFEPEKKEKLETPNLDLKGSI